MLIPAGEFMMGTSKQSTIVFTDETPQHLVKISKPFYLGIYEVTQREYSALLSGLNPSIVRNETLPVNNVDWDDAANFCRRLSDKEQRRYRLPTEAEWEYACWSGTNDWLQQSKISELGWHSNNAKQRPHPVGSLKPNPFGLFDMFGNVSEWCHDWYFSGYYADSPTLNPAGPINGSSRISRGGNWDDSTDRCRRAYRGASSPTHRSDRLGFRVLLETGAHRESALTAGQASFPATKKTDTSPAVSSKIEPAKAPPYSPVAKTSTPIGSEKRNLTKDDVVGVWRHKPGTAAPGNMTLHANGKINDLNGKNTWSFQGTTLILRWPNSKAPGGEWVDTVKVSEDGNSYKGFNQNRHSITGEKVRP